MAGVRQEREQIASEGQVPEPQGYIEEVESKGELVTDQGSGLRPAPSTTPVPPPVIDDGGQVVLQAANSGKKTKIVLPLTEVELKQGLHHKVFDGFRWLAEWCNWMIKKYPGRVFYPVGS